MRIVKLTLALTLTVMGADIPRGPVVKPAVKAPARTVVRSDADIEGDIRRRFAKSKIAEDGFTVKVRGGVALIEGKTKVIQRKGVATRLARLGGARRVDNQVQIDEAARKAAAAKLSKGRARADGHGEARRRVQPVSQR
jgi:hypothetical protein